MAHCRSILVGVLLLATHVALGAAADEGTVLQVIEDFESMATGVKRPAIVYWSWTPEQKAASDTYSSVEVVTGSPFGQNCLKVHVDETLPPRDPGYSVYSLGVSYLPPEADAIRMRVKMLEGRLTLSVGGPTIYFGHSDVMTRAITLDAATHSEWTTIEFDLQASLTRNFRRSQWAHNAPIIYYARWVQEPIGIDVARGGAGGILIDQIELVGYGKGRPFPAFAPEEIKPIGPGITFEDPASTKDAFTVMTSVTDVPDFSKPTYAVRRDWTPPRLARVEVDGGHALEVTMTGTEEVCFAGVKVRGSPDANAISLKVRAEHGKREEIVLDFVAYTSPAGMERAFPWEALRPPVSWRESPHAFTYYLSPRLEAVKPVSFGLYHIRRVVARGEWTTVVLPLSDFLCFYGQGEMQDAFAHQRPLVSDGLFALTFLSYYGQRSAPTRIIIDDVRLVSVPGAPEEHQSYMQRQAP